MNLPQINGDINLAGWIVRGGVGIFLGIMSWTALRFVSQVDDLSKTAVLNNIAIVSIQADLSSVKNFFSDARSGINHRLDDHDSSLRQDREILLNHGNVLSGHEARIKNVESSRRPQ